MPSKKDIAEVLYLIALCQLELGNRSKALQSLSQALRNDSKHAKVSRFNRPLYLLLSGFARGQALGCHAVARADRMQKSMQKHCRDHGKRLVCRSESSASSTTTSFNFFSKPLVLTLPPPRPSLG